MANKTYYLDYAATAPMSEAVFQKMQPYFCETFGNPSSVHELGQSARLLVDAARKCLADFIGAYTNEIYFTSGGTESDNLAIRMGAMLRKDRGMHVITTRMEHPAVLETFLALRNEGFSISFLEVDESGVVNAEQLEMLIQEDTILISVMAANHEVGTLQPIREIAEIAKKRDILFHTDAVQAFGHIPLDVRELGVDMMSVSAHKIGGPKGVGFLYVRKGLFLKPMVYGGGQERGLRSGTENVAGIAGFCAAAEERFNADFSKEEHFNADSVSVNEQLPADKNNEGGMKQFHRKMATTAKIRDYMISRLTKEIPNCKLSGDASNRLPGNIHLRFEGMEAHQLVLGLSKRGIYVSAGSACHSADPRPSHVLKAMGFSHREAYSGLRISFDESLSKEDADEIIKIMKEEVCRIG